VAIGPCVCVVLLLQAAAFAQTHPDFTGTWRLNQAKSNPNVGGNGPLVPFSSELLVKQTPTELHVTVTSVRQEPMSAVFKLDGSKVTMQAPAGITETGDAKFDGSKIVITSRRSFTSPLGETVVDFKEVWTINGTTLTVEKTRSDNGETATEKAVYDKS
jgi:hypothetical protein